MHAHDFFFGGGGGGGGGGGDLKLDLENPRNIQSKLIGMNNDGLRSSQSMNNGPPLDLCPLLPRA